MYACLYCTYTPINHPQRLRRLPDTPGIGPSPAGPSVVSGSRVSRIKVAGTKVVDGCFVFQTGRCTYTYTCMHAYTKVEYRLHIHTHADVAFPCAAWPRAGRRQSGDVCSMTDRVDWTRSLGYTHRQAHRYTYIRIMQTNI